MAASSQHHHLHHFAALDSAAPVVTREEAAKLHVTAPPATAVTTTVPVADGVAAQPTDDPVAQAAHDPYYWEPGGTPTPVNLLTHNVHWLATSVLHGVEYVGEILGDFFGLFNARYEWAAEADRQRQAQFEEDEMRAEQQKRWEQIRRMNATEASATTASRDVSAAAAQAATPLRSDV